MNVEDFVKNSRVQPDNYKPMRFYGYFKSTYYIPLLFGYNYLAFPVSKSRFVRVIFSIYSLLLSYGSSVLVLSYIKHINWSPYVFITAEYVTTVTLLIIKNSRNMEWFFSHIERIDDQLHVGASYYNQLRKVTLISVLFALSTRILYSTALCYSFQFYCYESPALFFYTFVLIAVDMKEIPRLIVFHLIKYRMSLLKERVENLFHNETVSTISLKERKKHLVMYHEIYGGLLDAISIVSQQINPYFMLSLVFSVPKIMFLVHNIIVLHKRGVPSFHLLVLSLEPIQWGLIACLPGIVFEFTRAEVDRLKLFLLKKYRDCKDETLRPAIKEFLDYMETRPCQYYLYRLIPVDVTLPVGLLHLCTTYLIVMVQFSHLFETTD